MKFPRVIFVAGLPGSGKTFVAKKLAEKMGARHISSDIVRKELDRAGKYRDRDKQLVYDEMKRRMTATLESGKEVILDATFYRKALREEFIELATRYSDQIFSILTVCSEEVTKERVSKKRPDSEADFKVYEIVRDLFEPLTGEYLTIRTDKEDINISINNILHYCNIV